MGFGFFQGSKIKILKEILSLNGAAEIDGNSVSANTVIIADSSKTIKSTSTSTTELGYVTGVTSSIQTQLNLKADRFVYDIPNTTFSVTASTTNTIVTLDTNIHSAHVFWSLQDTTNNGYQAGNSVAVHKNASWELINSIAGSATFGGVNLTISSGGALQLISPSVSGTFYYRVATT